MIPQSVITQLKTAAKLFPKQECCGLLTSDFQLFPIKNVSRTPQTSFVFDKVEYVKTLGHLAKDGLEVLAVYHTHPVGGCTPSEADLAFIKASGSNALIVSSTDYIWIDYATVN